MLLRWNPSPDFRSLREWRGSQVVLLFRPKPLSLLRTNIQSLDFGL